MKKLLEQLKNRDGKIGYVVAWALGVPVPLLIIVYLLRGCE